MRYYDTRQYGLKSISQSEYNELSENNKFWYEQLYRYYPRWGLGLIYFTVHHSGNGLNWGETDVQRRRLGWIHGDVFQVNWNRLKAVE